MYSCQGLQLGGCSYCYPSLTRFSSGPLLIRVPFFSYYLALIREPKKDKGQKGTSGEPSEAGLGA